MRRRRTEGRRATVTDLSLLTRGEHWSLDVTPNMGGLGLDGDAYAAIFAEYVTGYLFIVPMKDKTTASFIKAIEELLRFMGTHLPGVVLRVLTADSDPTWRTTVVPSPLYTHLHVKELDGTHTHDRTQRVRRCAWSDQASYALGPLR